MKKRKKSIIYKKTSERNFNILVYEKIWNKLRAHARGLLRTSSVLINYFLHYFLYFTKGCITTLRKKYPNTEFFLVLIFPHLEFVRRDTKYLSVYSLNAGKYGPEKAPYLDTFHAVQVFDRVLNTPQHALNKTWSFPSKICWINIDKSAFDKEIRTP